MHFATINHIHISKTANLDFASEITLDANGARRLRAIKTIAFGPAGKTYPTVLLARFLQN
jgi:hypothetical protein